MSVKLKFSFRNQHNCNKTPSNFHINTNRLQININNLPLNKIGINLPKSNIKTEIIVQLAIIWAKECYSNLYTQMSKM